MLNEQNNHFVLHIGPQEHEAIHEVKLEPKAKPEGKSKPSPKWVQIVRDAGRQIFVTLLILVVGFLAMNWSAYYQIAKNEYNKLFGEPNSSTLSQVVEIKNNVAQKLIETGDSTIGQIKKIPDLGLDVAPPDIRLIIPRINQNLPVVRVSSENLISQDWDALEKDIQEKLKDGVIHYPGTSFPDDGGNTVITGHSSYFPWDPGRFKDVFALLSDVDKGDKIALYYKQKKYIYQISDKKVVMPSEIDILKQPGDLTQNKLTLITCTPVGTNLKRLVVIGDLIATE